MRLLQVFVVLLGLGWSGCTELRTPPPVDGESVDPSEAVMDVPEEPEEVRDAGRSKRRTSDDVAESDAPQAELDAGYEGEAEPNGPAMPGDAGATPGDAAAIPGDASGEPVTDPNAGGSAMPMLTGSWSGPAEDLLQRQYQACFVIEQITAPGPAGTVRYTGALMCEYDIAYKGFSDGEFTFDSVVRSGSGCFPNELRLPAPSGDMVRFNMYINGGNIPEGAGTLTRVDACP